jgi:hypothetical protein
VSAVTGVHKLLGPYRNADGDWVALCSCGFSVRSGTQAVALGALQLNGCEPLPPRPQWHCSQCAAVIDTADEMFGRVEVSSPRRDADGEWLERLSLRFCSWRCLQVHCKPRRPDETYCRGWCASVTEGAAGCSCEDLVPLDFREWEDEL